MSDEWVKHLIRIIRFGAVALAVGFLSLFVLLRFAPTPWTSIWPSMGDQTRWDRFFVLTFSSESGSTKLVRVSDIAIRDDAGSWRIAENLGLSFVADAETMRDQLSPPFQGDLRAIRELIWHPSNAPVSSGLQFTIDYSPWDDTRYLVRYRAEAALIEPLDFKHVDLFDPGYQFIRSLGIAFVIGLVAATTMDIVWATRWRC